MVKTLKIIQGVGMALLSVILIVLWILRVIGLILVSGTESALLYIENISTSIQTNEAKSDGDGPNG